MALNLKVFSANYKLCATNYKVNRASHAGRNIHATVLFSGSWLVKICHYTRTGCGKITLAGSPRASPYVRPLAVFLRPATGHLRTAFIFSSPICDFNSSNIFRIFSSSTISRFSNNLLLNQCVQQSDNLCFCKRSLFFDFLAAHHTIVP